MDPREQRIQIKDRADELCHEDRIYILGILKQQLSPDRIVENRDGSRVNLDRLSDTLVNKLHHIMTSKLKISKKDTI